MAEEAGRGRDGVALIALAGIAALMYAPGGPVWDDHTLIIETLVPLDGAGLLNLWTQPVGGGEVGTGYYRPLAMTALALLGRIGIPAIHLLAAALHMGSTALLGQLLVKRGPSPAMLGPLLFAVHPLAGEALGWASALPDVMAVHFGLWAVWAARRSWMLSAGFLLAGALSKETALLILPFALLGGLAPTRGWLAWGLGAIGAIGLRLAAGTGTVWTISGKDGLVAGALMWPLGSLAVPHPLTAVRDLLVMPSWAFTAGFAVLGVMVFGAIRLTLRGRPTARLAWAGLALALAAPALALPPTLTGYLAAERYAYPALVGAAFWVSAMASLRWLMPGMVLGVMSLGVHILRAPAWRSDEALFSSATESLPTSSYAWHFLGMSRARSGDLTGAADALEEAVVTGHPHPMDRSMALRAMVESEQYARALAWAEAGPSEGLTAEDLALWAMAAWRDGDEGRARELVGMLETPTGYDGPDWVGELAAEMAE